MTNEASIAAKYPIGSLESRAAARRILEDRQSSLDLVEMYSEVEGITVPEFGEWQSLRPGSMTRRCRLPLGMSFDEALKAAGQPTMRTRGEHLRLKIDL